MAWAHSVKAVGDVVSTHQYRVLSWMLLIALGLIITMAIISNTSNRIHPDEFDHVAAARFYLDNWLPPAVADPRTLDSYSYAGASYLNEWDISYLFAGKFALLIKAVVQNEIYAFRFFNVFLFLLLTCMAWIKRDEVLTFAVLLLSPQIWYVFSYFNNDAFAIFLSLLAAYELTSSRSAFNDRTRGIAARYLRLGLYIGLMILSKRTYWMFAVFTLCYAALTELWHSRNHDWRFYLRQAGMLTGIICAVAVPRVCYDLYVNGLPSQKTEKMIATANLLADDAFKPNRIGSSKYAAGINLKSRGMGFLSMNGDLYWPKESVKTAFGVYHYLLIRGPLLLYVLAAGCVGLLVAYLFFAIILKGNSHDKIILALSVGCCLGVIGLSLYHSWTNDFQPQGRYLFAIFSILGVLLIRSKQILNSVFVNSVIGVSFLFSSYSFIFVGLNHIPKYWERVESPVSPVLKLEREWKQSH